MVGNGVSMFILFLDKWLIVDIRCIDTMSSCVWASPQNVSIPIIEITIIYKKKKKRKIYWDN